jgi:hypothetical protein
MTRYSEAGKGGDRRPTNYESFSKHFEEIFGARPKVTEAEFNNPPTPPQDDQPQTHRPQCATPQP